MLKIFLLIFCIRTGLPPEVDNPSVKEKILSAGKQPQASMATDGKIRIVFGRKDSIFCATSINKGNSFSVPLFIGQVTGMHLGMTRGPQITSSATTSLITAIDKNGNIHYYLLSHKNDKWEYRGFVNDVPGAAPEGLMSIAADDKDQFYAVWLDIRHDKKNNICFSAFQGKDRKWKKNKIIYISPDEHVCECCKPGIAVNGNTVAIMFRNWMNGSRDLYLKVSENKGKIFLPEKKLGAGTWKLNGCPMDGGGVFVDDKGVAHTVWQREGIVYYCKAGQPEQDIAKGRFCGVSAGMKAENIFIVLQDGGKVKMYNLKYKKETVLGGGSFIRTLILPGEIILAVWENEGNVVYKIIDS